MLEDEDDNNKLLEALTKAVSVRPQVTVHPPKVEVKVPEQNQCIEFTIVRDSRGKISKVFAKPSTSYGR